MPDTIHILGAGLAGSEAAYQVARQGLRAVLYEMRPSRQTSAHQTDRLAELVCSNSLKTDQEGAAPWLLKQERWAEAQREFEAVLRLEPGNPRAEKNLAWLRAKHSGG